MRNDVETDIAISLLESASFRQDERAKRLEKQVLAAAVLVEAVQEMVEKLRREVAGTTDAQVTGVLNLTRADVEILLEVVDCQMLRDDYKPGSLNVLRAKIVEALK